MSDAVEIVGVSKAFANVQAVNNLSLRIPSNCTYGFIGPNGSGKSTTLRMIMRIIYPDTGTIRVLGEESHSSANDRIGYLPEERGLYKKMKVAELLCYHAELKGIRQPLPRVLDWLERLDLGKWAKSKVESLSKGMAQKVQFIATVVANPELILLDEPFSGLDPVNNEVIRKAIIDLKNQGSTVIFSTHDMRVAELMCDSIFMIYKGNKVLDGTLDEIQNEYGEDTIRVRVIPRPGSSYSNGMLQHLYSGLPGVNDVKDLGHLKELLVARGADTHAILGKLAERGQVVHFEVTKPSLHDIFVRIANPKAEEMNVAATTE